MKHLILALLSVNLVFSEIIYEQGSLTEFIAGNSPETSYENWLSHVTEGVASPGFNDYGPEWLDIQTNGFGNHRVLTENSPTLHYWETIFNYFVAGDTTYVDSLLQDSIQSFFYELVIFQDTTYGRTFHLLREQLDSSYIDYNNPELESDDIIGGFQNGWGLYIISPDALREQILIQVPHPCDDFIAPYIAIDACIPAMMLFGYNFPHLARDVGRIRPINVKEMGEMEGEKCEREHIGAVAVQRALVRLYWPYGVVPKVCGHTRTDTWHPIRRKHHCAECVDVLHIFFPALHFGDIVVLFPRR